MSISFNRLLQQKKGIPSLDEIPQSIFSTIEI